MALPTILVNSATGSDTQASGAGPATALFGSTGVTAADGLTVNLIADAPDLSGVATDGSAVLFLADTNAGSRNFGKITAVNNTTKVVTVSDAFQGSDTDAWAIGGKRASIGGTTSVKLIENNAGNGDAMPGWIIEMESAHAETIAATLTIRRAGDTTSGPITLRGVSGAGTLPLLTFSNNGNALVGGVTGGWVLRDFGLRNSNATKTASVAITLSTTSATGLQYSFTGIQIGHSTNKFWKGILTSGAGASMFFESCEVGYCANNGMEFGSTYGTELRNCWVHDSGAHGISYTATQGDRVLFYNNLINFNATDGMNMAAAAGAGTSPRSVRFLNNTVHGNGGDGLEIADPMNTTQCVGTWLANNIFTYNGGYGVNFSGSGMSNARATCQQTVIENNCFSNNTSGTISVLTIDTGTVTADPSGGLATATKDYAGVTGGSSFAVGTQVQALGFPLAGTMPVGKYSSTYSYEDIGAAQRQEAGGGAPVPFPVHFAVPVVSRSGVAAF